MNRQKWTKTDTASIMFTSLTSKNWGRTFAFSATMKADIDPAVLRTAANDVLPHYPSACTDLRSGFFWRYQIIADAEAELRPAGQRPLLRLGRPDPYRQPRFPGLYLR